MKDKKKIDIILPKFDGYELCRKIRIDSQVTIIILTALSKLSNRIRGLELGADDYIIKPFSPPELEARIRSVLRRTSLNQVFTTQKKKDTLLTYHTSIELQKVVYQVRL